ncbi:MAG: GNAT family N-acetyltransferase [Rhodobacteraceae bacterium]|nr:GNAT family N-acetyltransferase [Paracoccaceae bacterium]
MFGCNSDAPPPERAEEPGGGSRPSQTARAPAPPSPAQGMLMRPWRARDVPRFVRLLDDPEVWKLLPEPYPDPLDEALARELIALSNAGRHHLVRAVVLDGVPVGQVRLSFAPGTSDRSRAEIGYWLGRDHWGRRIGHDMVARFSAQCFAMMPALQTQFARVHGDNLASRRVLEKCGFALEGPCPDHPGFDILTRQRPG